MAAWRYALPKRMAKNKSRQIVQLQSKASQLAPAPTPPLTPPALHTVLLILAASDMATFVASLAPSPARRPRPRPARQLFLLATSA